MTTSVASDGQRPLAGASNTPGRAAEANLRATPGRGSAWPRIRGLLNDAALLLLVVLAFPLVILLLGAPVALLVRLLAAIARAVGRPLD